MPAYKVKQYNGVSGSITKDWGYVKKIERASSFALAVRQSVVDLLKVADPSAELTDRGLRIFNQSWDISQIVPGHFEILAMRECATALAIASGMQSFPWRGNASNHPILDELIGLGSDFEQISKDQQIERFAALLESKR